MTPISEDIAFDCPLDLFFEAPFLMLGAGFALALSLVEEMGETGNGLRFLRVGLDSDNEGGFGNFRSPRGATSSSISSGCSYAGFGFGRSVGILRCPEGSLSCSALEDAAFFGDGFARLVISTVIVLPTVDETAFRDLPFAALRGLSSSTSKSDLAFSLARDFFVGVESWCEKQSISSSDSLHAVDRWDRLEGEVRFVF